MTGPLRVAVLEHDGPAAAAELAGPAAAAELVHTVDAELIRAPELPDILFRLRKIGDAPGRMPGAIIALLRGDFDVAHAFTPQDAVVALAWSRVTKRPVVYTQRGPLTRANVADRRLRLEMLRPAVERSDVVIAPDEGIAESLRRWMAVEPRVLPAGSGPAGSGAPGLGAQYLRLYSELVRR